MQRHQSQDNFPAAKLFQEKLVSANNVLKKDFREWLFLPGMLFGAGEKWWGKGGKRDTPHEGLDICYYRTTNQYTKQIELGTKIPALYPGIVTAICDDFLGKSIFIKHAQYHKTGTTLYTAYGHTIPAREIQPGIKVQEGELIGTAADPRTKKAKVPCHIHLSAAWIPGVQPGNGLNWEVMKNVHLLDPLNLLEMPYVLISKLED